MAEDGDGQSCGDVGASSESQSFTPPPRRQLCFILMVIGTFCGQMGLSIIIPFFPKEAEAKQVSQFVIGLIFAVFELAIIFGTPLATRLMVRFGSRPLLVVGNLLGGLCNVLMGACWALSGPALFASVCLVLRVLAGIAFAIFATTCYGLLPALYGPTLSTATGVLEGANGVAFIMGPVVGAFLFAASGGVDGMGYVVPFLLLGAVEFVFGCLNACLLPKMPDPPQQQPQLLGSFSWKVSVPVLHSIIMSACFNVLNPTFEDHLTNPPLRLSVEGVGVVFAVACLAYTLFSPLVGILDDKTDARYAVQMMAGGCFFCAVSYGMMAPAPIVIGGTRLVLNQLDLYVSMVILGFGATGGYIPLYKQILRCAKHESPEEREVATGALFTIVMSLGGFVGPLVGGAWAQSVGTASCYTQFGFFLFVWSVALAFVPVLPCLRRGGDVAPGDARDVTLLQSSGSQRGVQLQ